jgi:hypothetical protein
MGGEWQWESGSGWVAVSGTVGKRRLRQSVWYQNHDNRTSIERDIVDCLNASGKKNEYRYFTT